MCAEPFQGVRFEKMAIPKYNELYSLFLFEMCIRDREWNGERSFMAQHAILRFEKHKGNPARPLEAHHERQKEQYASNPDIDTSRSKYNFYIVKPEGRYYHFIQSRIEQAGCRTRKDSTRFVDTLITASPEFFKKKSPKEIQEFFQRAEMCIRDRPSSLTTSR